MRTPVTAAVRAVLRSPAARKEPIRSVTVRKRANRSDPGLTLRCLGRLKQTGEQSWL